MLRIIMLAIALSFAAGPAASKDAESRLKLSRHGNEHHIGLKFFCENALYEAEIFAFHYSSALGVAKYRSATGSADARDRNQWLQNLANLAVTFNTFCKHA